MRALPLAIGIAAIWTGLALSGALEDLERLTVQARYMLRPAPGFTAPVTVVAIDERSLSRFGQMPWDRRLFARLLDRLSAEGATVVGIDVAFNEPSRDAAEDRALADALARTPTVLPTFLAYADAGRQAQRSIEPLAPFAARAVALGSVQLSGRSQTQVWELEPYQNALGRWVPAFPVAVFGAFRGQAWSPPPPRFPWKGRPTMINYRGPANHAPLVSAVDVLEGRVPRAQFAGRMVLVGATASGLPDTNFAVPDLRAGPMSGVELSATVIDNLLKDDFLRRFDPLALGLLMGLAAWWPGRLLARGGDGPAHRTTLLLGASALWLALAAAAFWAGVWLEVVPVVAMLTTCHLAGMVAERTDLLESRNQLLGRYTSDLASEAQRQRARIEGELHDGIQQQLIVISREVRQLLRLEPSAAAEVRLRFLAEQTEQAQGEIKRLRGDLMPPALRHGGLLEALPVLANERAGRNGLRIEVEVAGWEPLAQSREIELYWLINEAITNAEKHAQPTRIGIQLARTRDEALITVEDDGRGFVPPDLSVAPTGLEHSGLHRMWLRMRGNHGNLKIDSSPGAGTRLRFSLPIEARRNNE